MLGIFNLIGQLLYSPDDYQHLPSDVMRQKKRLEAIDSSKKYLVGRCKTFGYFFVDPNAGTLSWVEKNARYISNFLDHAISDLEDDAVKEKRSTVSRHNSNGEYYSRLYIDGGILERVGMSFDTKVLVLSDINLDMIKIYKRED